MVGTNDRENRLPPRPPPTLLARGPARGRESGPGGRSGRGLGTADAGGGGSGPRPRASARAHGGGAASPATASGPHLASSPEFGRSPRLLGVRTGKMRPQRTVGGRSRGF